MGLPFWRKALGIALVEFAGILVVLVPLVVGGIVVGDYAQSVSLVNGAVHTRIVDGVIGSTATRAVSVYRLVGNALQVRSADLTQLTSLVRDALATDLEGRFSGASSQDYLVEVAWATLNINTATGQVLSATPAQLTAVSRGGLSVQHPRTFAQEFERFAQEAMSADQPGLPSSLAIPFPLHTMPGANRFAAQAVLLGARVAVRSGSTFTRDTLSTFGIDPTIRDFRAVHLRGDVS